jgi:hypothetical protein
MCSKPNPDDADVCGFCGARLSPLVVDPSEAQVDLPPRAADEPTPAASESEDIPDWLARVRERAEAESPEPEPEGEGPDWLSRLRAAESEEPGPPQGELPDWLEGGEEAEPEEEDWLSRLRSRDDASEFDEAGTAEAESEEDVLEEEDLADRIADLGGALEAPAREITPPEAEGKLDRLDSDLPTEAEDWVAAEEPQSMAAFPSQEFDLDSEELDEPGETAVPDFADEVVSPGAEARPDWFDDFELAAEEEPLEAVEAAEEEAELPTEPDELDWLREEPTPPSVDEPAAALDESGTGELDWDSFDWEDMEEEAAAAPAEPSLGMPPEESLPHVPALIVGEGEDPLSEDIDDFSLDAIELPDWLSEAEGEGIEPEAEERGRDLAPATIPSWLEAMRPVETFQPVVELEPEEEQAVESVGPLAGLRGVLLAEPVVAKPRTATTTGARLQVSERQYAQAELLRRIVEEEEQERAAARREPFRLPLVRWLITLGLLVAVLLPPIMGFPAFNTPQRVSRDLGSIIEVVNGLSAERPALLVFDYEPGYNAELEGVAGALIENLMARQVHVVTLSTRPTGPPLALDLIASLGQAHAIENGRDFLHLGYLSGGPSAVLLFSAAPEEAVLKGFMLPQDLETASVWDQPILRGVDSLSDFSMVAVVAAGTDTARIWAEQATPWLGETPMVMVLSAGAEPLIRPYFESLDPQVDGILTGLPAAVAYEQINGRPGLALARWNAFGAGVFAVELALLAGVVYGLGSWVSAFRRERE